jgi:hypothetical protein
LPEQAKISRAKEDLLATFSTSKGLLDKFKKRQGIKSYKLHGEANDTNQMAVKLV